ncbi:hypothetical protein ETD83_39170 [Actinomadura soli]|uniref:Uncharacterized protein n=2 Tax=Actinomadura soli TaxID=2508997 RepID=A0A5C4IZA3_9ACTN|nr:hypothetical protein ETD83_39170 [Actinomadura soli]
MGSVALPPIQAPAPLIAGTPATNAAPVIQARLRSGTSATQPLPYTTFAIIEAPWLALLLMTSTAFAARLRSTRVKR